MQIIDLVPNLKPTILAARQVRDANNTLARYLPNRSVMAISYRLGRRQRFDQTVKVRAFGAPAVPIKRPGILEVRGDLPALTPIINLSESDLNDEFILAQQLAGLNVDWAPYVDSCAALAALTIDNTLEVMRGQVLSTLELTLATDDDNTYGVDFGADTANQVITVATAWDDGATAAQKFEDLKSAHSVYKAKRGAPAGIMLTTEAVYVDLLNALQTMFPQQPVGQDQLSAYLANQRLPQVETYDRQLGNEDGTYTRVYPEGTLTFLPAADDPLGETQLGITQEAVQQVQERVLAPAEAPGITIVTLGDNNPVTRAVKGAAVGMPVLRDIDSAVVLNGLFTEE